MKKNNQSNSTGKTNNQQNKSRSTQSPGPNQRDIQPQRDPEDQNKAKKEYVQKDKKDGSPDDQRV